MAETKVKKKTTNKTPKTKLTEEEIKYRDMIQEYAKKHIFYEEEFFCNKVPKLFWTRIAGILENEMFSRIGKDNDVVKLYTYEEVYETLLYMTDSIDFAMKNTNFNNVTHLVNYIMKIIENNIPNIHVMNIRRKKEKERIELLNNKVEQVECNSNNNDDYITKNATDVDDSIAEEFF